MPHEYMGIFLRTTVISILLLHINCLSSKHNNPVSASLYIGLIYPSTEENGTQINTTVCILQNGIQNQSFMIPAYPFQCSNLNLFTLEQKYTTQTGNKPYTLVIQNISNPISVGISSYNSAPTTTPSSFSCPSSSSTLPPSSCSTLLMNNCQYQQSYNIVTITLTQSSTNEQMFQFAFNYLCNAVSFENSILPPNWSDLILVIFSIFMIFLCSKFQQCKAYNNATLYVNIPIIFIINGVSIARFVVVGLNVHNNQTMIRYVCYGITILATLPATMVCFCEAVYFFCPSLFKYGCNICLCNVGNKQIKFRVRLMDGVGLALGVGILCGVYFSYFNWIVNDAVFLIIFVASVKIIKFGSLRISLLAFSLSLILSIIFVVLTQTLTSSYETVNYFSNPLFLQIPSIPRTPNVRCSWYFILLMLYPATFLAYLQRFDKNKSSLIYSPTFLICYGLCSIAWFIVSSLINAPLPYDLLTVPISMILLVLFANRRGELRDIWEGRFYDQQRSYLENQCSMIEKLDNEKSASGINYDREMFNNLKYGEKSEDESNSSKFSEIIKGADRQKITELRYIYSQGETQLKEQKRLQQRDPLSNQTQRVSDIRPSEAQSGKWILSKFS